MNDANWRQSVLQSESRVPTQPILPIARRNEVPVRRHSPHSDTRSPIETEPEIATQRPDTQYAFVSPPRTSRQRHQSLDTKTQTTPMMTTPRQ